MTMTVRHHGDGFWTGVTYEDDSSLTTYTPFIDDNLGCAGIICRTPGRPPRFITLNPSGETDDGVANVFVYIDDNSHHLVNAVHHYDIWED